MNKCTLLFSALACCSMLNTLSAKILIITLNHNRPDFITLQHRSFNRFLHDNYEFVVFNDATEESLITEIDTTCAKLGINCMRCTQENRTPATGTTNPIWAMERHAQGLHYALQTIGFHHDNIVMIIDSDMILIKDFSVADFMQGYDMAGLKQSVQPSGITKPATYLWAGLMFFRMNALPQKETMRFNHVYIKKVRTDTGGALHEYLQRNPAIKIRFFDQKYRHILTKDLDNTFALAEVILGTKIIYPKCAVCKSNKKTCSHAAAILRELNIDQRIVHAVEQKTFPPETEFVLNDTFLHYRATSNYASTYFLSRKNITPEFLHEKSRLFALFMDMILA